ncbi:MAG: TonB-dependent receptor [Bacteroidota bacterium]
MIFFSRLVAVLCVVLGILSPCLEAQTGKISGIVTEKQTGEPLAGVTVVLSGTQKGALTDVNGQFSIISIEPGSYDVQFSYIGFATIKTQNVQVNSGRTSSVNAEMQEEVVMGEEITVTAAPPIVKKDQTSTVSFVSKETIEDLPVLEVQDVVRFQPGVVTTSGGGLSFRGGRTREVAYVVDGIPVQDVFSQGGGNTIDLEVQSVQELQVLTGTFDAEMGGAQSGVVNVTTREPSKRLDGTLLVRSGGFYEGLDNTFIDGDVFNPLQTNDVSLTLSGPLSRDKETLGFFLTSRFEDRVGHLKGERRFTPDDGFALANYRDWYIDQFTIDDNTRIPLDTARTPGGEVILTSTGDTLTFGSGDGRIVDMEYNQAFTINPKFVFRPSPRTKLSLNTIYNLSESQGYNDSKRFAPDGRIVNDAYAWTSILTYKQTLSNNAVLNLRGSYKLLRRESAAFDDINDPGYQFVSFSDPVTGFFLGGTENGRTRFEEDQWIFSGDASWQVNFNNEIKAGFQFRSNTFITINESLAFFDSRFPDNLREAAQVRPPGGTNPFFDLYLQEVQAFQDSVLQRRIRNELIGESTRFEQTPIEFAAFVQDKLELSSNLVVKVGLRYEYYDTNGEFIQNTQASTETLGANENLGDAAPKSYLSPRVGISFPISERGAFRVAYGHFTQMPAYSQLFQNPIDENTTRLQIENRTIGNPDLDPERTVKYEMGLQHEISSFMGIDVNLFYKNIRNLLGLQILATSDGAQYTQTVNRDYGIVRGGTISLFANPKGWLNAAGLDVTYQDAQSSSSDPGAIADALVPGLSGQGPSVVVDRNIIPLDWDQPLTANAYLVFGKPGDWNVSLIHQLATGQPFTPSFIDEEKNQNFPENFLDNSELKPTLITFDVSAEKQFRLNTSDLTFRVQVNNVFNYLNQRTVNSISGQADQIVRIPDVQNLRSQRNEAVGLFTDAEDNMRPTWFSTPREILFSIQLNF